MHKRIRPDIAEAKIIFGEPQKCREEFYGCDKNRKYLYTGSLRSAGFAPAPIFFREGM